MCGETESTQSKDTNKLNFTCYGGCLFSLLVILLLGIIYSKEQSIEIQFCLETFNGKKTGINCSILEELNNNAHDYEEASIDIVKSEFEEKFPMQPPFIIVRFVDILKKVLKNDQFKFSWGVGTTSSGIMEDNTTALVSYDLIKLSPQFRKFRNGKTKNIFSDYFNPQNDDENVREIDYKFYLLEKARGTIEMFHPLSGILPLDTCMNIYHGRENRYSSNHLFTMGANESYESKSNILKTQQYSVPLR